MAYFNDAQIGISVPLVYPLLLYLLVRLLWIGLDTDSRREHWRPGPERRHRILGFDLDMDQSQPAVGGLSRCRCRRGYAGAQRQAGDQVEGAALPPRRIGEDLLFQPIDA